MSIGNVGQYKIFQTFWTQSRVIYIYYTNRRHTQKKTPGRKKVLTLQKPVQILKNISEYIRTYQNPDI